MQLLLSLGLCGGERASAEDAWLREGGLGEDPCCVPILATGRNSNFVVLSGQSLASRSSEASPLLLCKQLGLPIALGLRLRGGVFAVRVQGRREALDQLPYLQRIVKDLLELHSLEQHGLVDLGILEIQLESFGGVESRWRPLRCSRQVPRGVIFNEAALVLLFIVLLPILGRQNCWFLVSKAALALCLVAFLWAIVSSSLGMAQW